MTASLRRSWEEPALKASQHMPVKRDGCGRFGMPRNMIVVWQLTMACAGQEADLYLVRGLPTRHRGAGHRMAALGRISIRLHLFRILEG